jgi:hypothetical protein
MRETAAIASPASFRGTPRPDRRSPSVDCSLLVLWPFARPVFRQASSLLRPLLTPPLLSQRRPDPGKVPELSARIARLYLVRLSVTFGFRILSHAHRPHPASLPVRVPTIVPLLRTSFALSASRHPPCPSLRLLSLLPVISFHSTSSGPCRAHECCATAQLWRGTLGGRTAAFPKRCCAPHSKRSPHLPQAPSTSPTAENIKGPRSNFHHHRHSRNPRQAAQYSLQEQRRQRSVNLRTCKSMAVM